MLCLCRALIRPLIWSVGAMQFTVTLCESIGWGCICKSILYFHFLFSLLIEKLVLVFVMFTIYEALKQMTLTDASTPVIIWESRSDWMQLHMFVLYLLLLLLSVWFEKLFSLLAVKLVCVFTLFCLCESIGGEYVFNVIIIAVVVVCLI